MSGPNCWRFFTTLVLSVLIVVIAAPPLPATGERTGAELDPNFQVNLARWQAMDQAERERVQGHYAVWRTLDEPSRQQIRINQRDLQQRDAEEQRELAASHQRWLGNVTPEQRSLLQQRLQRYRQLPPEHQQRAIAVGWFLAEAGDDVASQFQSEAASKRRNTVQALLDVYNELPPALRQRLDTLPPWRKQLVIRAVIQERQARFARLFHQTMSVPQERLLLHELISQLEPAERRLLGQLPAPIKEKLLRQLIETPESRRLSMLRTALAKHAEWRRQPSPPREPR
jgi:hypothetical protein